MEVLAKSIVTAFMFVCFGWFVSEVWSIHTWGKLITILGIILLCVTFSLFGVFATLKSMTAKKMNHINDGNEKMYVVVNVFGLKCPIEISEEKK